MKNNVVGFSVAALLLLVSVPVAWIVTAAPAQDRAQSPKQSEPAIAGELSKLLKARFDSAVTLLEHMEKGLKEGGHPTELEVRDAALRVRDSALEMTGDPGEQVAALTKYLAIARRMEQLMRSRLLAGIAPSSHAELGRYLRLDAEIALLRTKLQGGKVP